MTDKIFFIHIPKTAGSYISLVLLDKKMSKDDMNNSCVRVNHIPVTEINIRSKICFTVIRNPYSFYRSLYNFFHNPPHQILNKFQDFVKSYNNIDDFIKALLAEKHKLCGISLTPYDRFYVNSKNKYGLLTNYFLYFLGYKGDTGDVEKIKKFIDKRLGQVEILKQENLDQDLLDFAQKYSLNINENYYRQKINTSVKKQSEISHDMKKLIKEKDSLIFDLFYW